MLVNIKKIITKRRKESINIERPLQSNEPVIVDKKKDKYILVDGSHRYFKLLEMGRKNINVEIRRRS